MSVPQRVFQVEHLEEHMLVHLVQLLDLPSQSDEQCKILTKLNTPTTANNTKTK